MLAADAQTLLRVGHAVVFRRLVAEDYIFKLVHTRVRKHQRGIVLDYHWSGGNNLVSFFAEEVLERLANLLCSSFIPSSIAEFIISLEN